MEIPDTTTSFISEYEVVDIPTGDKGPVGETQGQGNVDADKSDIGETSDEFVDLEMTDESKSAIELFGGAKTTALKTSLKDKLLRAVEERHSAKNRFKNFITKIGRGVMGLFRSLRGVRPFYSAKSVSEFDQELLVAKPATEHASPKWKTAENGDAVEYDPDTLAAGFGLRGKASIRKFSADEIEEIRKSNFSLADIKQNPKLQDCWFLSSLGAFLNAKGPNAIADMIQIPDAGIGGGDPDHALVKLGRNIYKVPLGVINAGGHSSVSKSKPWVQLLETAMQMHLIKSKEGTLDAPEVRAMRNTTQYSPRLAYRTPVDAFGAFLGVPHDSVYTACINKDADFDAVRDFLAVGRPVVLGSPLGGFFALSTGISPEHAVTVLAVDESRGIGNRRVTVLDPYGHTTVLNERDLRSFKMIAATPEGAEANNLKDDLYGQMQAYRESHPGLEGDELANDPGYKALSDARNNVFVPSDNEILVTVQQEAARLRSQAD